MIFVNSPHPPGTVVILSNELSRYCDFTIALLRLKIPVGTRVQIQKGVEIVMGLNDGIRKMSGEWVFVMGDDHAFDDHLLLNLLDLDLDIVSPACSMRSYPHYPVLYQENDKGEFIHGPWSDVPPMSILKVAGAGSAGMLIRKRVLDAVGDPWFEAGMLYRENLSEDLWFCKKARNLGFEVHVDTRQALGHITPATIWPTIINNTMCPAVTMNGDERLRVRLDTGLRQEDIIVPTGDIDSMPLAGTPRLVDEDHQQSQSNGSQPR